jgi:hypothetical protein
VSYYNRVCESLGLNPLTRPFEYITLSGKLTFYARKDCTEQLRNLRRVSIAIVAREVTEGVYVVTARATDASGRSDESIGAVPIDKAVGGEARANAIMKAETKAKRRVTLSFCGLGMLDESETDSGATFPVDMAVTRPSPTVVEADVVPSASETPKASKEQIKTLRTVMTKAGIKERAEVLAWINEIIAPRVVISRLDLTPEECSKCINLAEPATDNKAAKDTQ